MVDIVEGETPNPAHCTPIGRCDVRNLPANLPAGTPIEVTFAYNSSGRLLVRVAIAGTEKRRTEKILRENGLSKAELESWRNRIAGEGASGELGARTGE
jgi:molecular chaperone DnaK